jgi:hypothetical protein
VKWTAERAGIQHLLIPTVRFTDYSVLGSAANVKLLGVSGAARIDKTYLRAAAMRAMPINSKRGALMS